MLGLFGTNNLPFAILNLAGFSESVHGFTLGKLYVLTSAATCGNFCQGTLAKLGYKQDTLLPS